MITENRNSEPGTGADAAPSDCASNVAVVVVEKPRGWKAKDALDMPPGHPRPVLGIPIRSMSTEELRRYNSEIMTSGGALWGYSLPYSKHAGPRDNQEGDPLLMFCDRTGRLTETSRPSSSTASTARARPVTLLEWARADDRPVVQSLLREAAERGHATATVTDGVGPGHIWAAEAFSLPAGALLISMVPTGRRYEVWQTTPRRRLLFATEFEDTARVFQQSFDRHAAKLGVPNRSEVI